MDKCAGLLWLVSGIWLAGCGGGASGEAGTSIDSAEETPVAVVPAPAVTLAFTRQPDAETLDPFAVFAFEASAAVDLECRLDEDHYEPCTSPHTVFPLAAGDHEFKVRLATSSGSDAELLYQWRVASLFAGTGNEPHHQDLVPTAIDPAPVPPVSWRGIFRINCDFSHSSYNDPIVYPGQEGAAHLHRFYGNTLLDADSDTESLFTTGESTCQGNELNKSAYWVPALLAPAYHPETGQREFDDHGEPAWKVVPAVVGGDEDAHEIFYYSAGVDDLAAIQPIPLGLKMIAGDHMGAPEAPQDSAIARWHCQSWEATEADNPRWSAAIPECLAPDRLRMDIFFPSCWNGTDLDSHDHKSHMAYPVDSGGSRGVVCPATHPVPILRVSFHYAFGVRPDVYDPATRSSRGWRLASDSYDVATAGAGGMSLHGDWFNAWYPEALEAVLVHCVQGGLDCHDGNLGNGYRLSGTRTGTGFEPAIINEGRGGH